MGEVSPTKEAKRGRTSTKSKKTTILRAVPATTACATAPLSPLERDMATLPNQEILSNIGSVGRISADSSDGQASLRSLPITINNAVGTRARSSSATALTPITAGKEMKFFSSTPDLKAIIGTYKRGIVQWNHDDKNASDPRNWSASESRSSSSVKSRRPQIHVVIPRDQRNRPLPTSPFFTESGSKHIRSASAELVNTCEVSPPSGTRVLGRNSMVSPISAQQHRAVKSAAAAINSQLSKPTTITEEPTQEIMPSQSNSSDDSHGDDGSSTYSKRSSMTSLEEAANPTISPKPINFKERSASDEFDVKSPVVAGVFQDEARAKPKPGNSDSETGPRLASASPKSRARRYAHHPPIEEDDFFQSTCEVRPLRRNLNHLHSTRARRSTSRTARPGSLLMSPTMGVLNQAIIRTESKQVLARIPSPTLSEAENDLEQHLTSYTDDNPFKWDELISQAAKGPPPAVPRKSSKRTSQLAPGNFRLSKVPGDHIASQLKREKSQKKAKGLTINIPPTPVSKRLTEDFFLSPIPIAPKKVVRTIRPSDAEDVILGILRNLESLDDLFAMAVVNNGFYRVFKRHELELMKSALRKQSPPAWEHREICYPGHDKLDDEDLETARQDYNPATYLKYYMRDMYIIAALKALIKEKCESFLRPEISVALLSDEPAEASRVDDALWRIWTFCKIFGTKKGREEDIVAQMDWLKGGVLVHQKTCTHSIFTTDAIDMSDTLASAPECFAKGNEDGLTAEQLFDMMELWNCLGVLLQPFEGRTIQAREFGVYDNTDVGGGDIDGEESMLDEWYYFLLTLGLSPVLDLSAPCLQADPSAFVLARQNGWMNWKAPIFGGTRRNFLKEAASRVYEDKIAMAYASSSTKDVQRQLSKQRIQRHITELRNRKNSGERLLEVRMSQERPISEWEGVITNLTRPRPGPSSNIVSHIPSLRPVAPSSSQPQYATVMAELPAAHRSPAPQAARPRSPPRRIVAEPLLPSPPPSTVASVADQWDARSIAPSMPSIDEHPAFRRPTSIPSLPEVVSHPAFRTQLQTSALSNLPEVVPNSTGSASISRPSTSAAQSTHSHSSSADALPAFQQHPLQQEIMNGDLAANTADRAVYRIVEMGFTAEQARQALRMTDLGDGLRVDRAVELLLRGQF
ncbi:hypothetical protein P154DRAFT_518769 [Amniculicola lignicola CBS 123094]|uniref:UBA domain-containing protein n=1 Tax=Amniculicola lignicola CBS 123094 TaxID=1392246 RepID=A0A6A5WYJ5_9PLEO|nr:hypothetical protein P154DRAFT_518769 [Amniculicola lignicola CBS 123094]